MECGLDDCQQDKDYCCDCNNGDLYRFPDFVLKTFYEDTWRKVDVLLHRGKDSSKSRQQILASKDNRSKYDSK